MRSEVDVLKSGAEKFTSKPDISGFQVAFVGFPSSVGASDRIAQIEKWRKDVKCVQPLVVDNFYKGPGKERTLTQAGFVEFHSEDAARRFLDALPHKTVS